MDWELGNSNLGKRKAKPEINPQRSLRLSGKNQFNPRGAEVAKEWPRRSAALQKLRVGRMGRMGPIEVRTLMLSVKMKGDWCFGREG